MNSITVTEWNRLIAVKMMASSLVNYLEWGAREDSTWTWVEQNTRDLREALQAVGDLEALTGPQWRAAARPFQIG